MNAEENADLLNLMSKRLAEVAIATDTNPRTIQYRMMHATRFAPYSTLSWVQLNAILAWLDRGAPGKCRKFRRALQGLPQRLRQTRKRKRPSKWGPGQSRKLVLVPGKVRRPRASKA